MGGGILQIVKEAHLSDININPDITYFPYKKVYKKHTNFSFEFIEENERPDVIITDPPRDGMHKKVVAQVLKIKAKRIVYVSCNSATQARDLALMKEKYKVTQIQPIDMFPQTHHVENIVVLKLRKSS